MRTYTKKEIATLLGVSTVTVENMVRDGRLPNPLPLHKNPKRWNADAIDQIKAAN